MPIHSWCSVPGRHRRMRCATSSGNSGAAKLAPRHNIRWCDVGRPIRMMDARQRVVPIGRQPHVRSKSRKVPQSLPPLQRSTYAKKFLALKGAALAGLATPMRTDRAINANTVVFMGSISLRSSCERRHKGRRRDRKRHQKRSAARCTIRSGNQLALNAPDDDIGKIPDLRSAASLGIVASRRASPRRYRDLDHRKRCRGVYFGRMPSCHTCSVGLVSELDLFDHLRPDRSRHRRQGSQNTLAYDWVQS